MAVGITESECILGRSDHQKIRLCGFSQRRHSRSVVYGVCTYFVRRYEVIRNSVGVVEKKKNVPTKKRARGMITIGMDRWLRQGNENELG